MTTYKYPWMEREANRKHQPKEVKPRPMIAKRTDKGKAEDRIFAVLKKGFLIDHPICECGRIDERTGKVCQRKATDVHHKKGRGILLNEVEWFLAVARPCHNWIGDHPKEAMKLGLSLSRLAKP